MSSYTLTLVLKPDLEEEARKELLEPVTKKMAKVDKEEMWGVRDLAYPIKRQNKGYYVHYLFSADPSEISSLDKMLKLEEDISRYLLVRV